MDKKHNGPSVNPILDSIVGKHDEYTRRILKERDDYAESLRAEIADLEQDKQRLDFLDKNLEKRMGWSVGVAPFGNINITSILMNKTSIRAAIDKARMTSSNAALTGAEGVRVEGTVRQQTKEMP